MAKTEKKKRLKLMNEFKRIQWPGWKENKTNHDPGILNTFVKVVCFTAVFVAFFVICDFALAALMSAAGL